MTRFPFYLAALRAWAHTCSRRTAWAARPTWRQQSNPAQGGGWRCAGAARHRRAGARHIDCCGSGSAACAASPRTRGGTGWPPSRREEVSPAAVWGSGSGPGGRRTTRRRRRRRRGAACLPASGLPWGCLPGAPVPPSLGPVRAGRAGAGRACGPREGGGRPRSRGRGSGAGRRTLRCRGLECCRRWQLSSPGARTAPRPPLTAPACALPAGRSAAAPQDGHQAEPHHLHQQHQWQD